ncbi:TetR family transcriptional regulator [Mycobacterium sp. SWH-M5]|nr:TetR family transcriptional regulator [Mycobacterium sp. SWH-M5]
MTEQLDRRADLTRLQILQAASRQFARTPYSLVSLDDILADAEVTKGALYFHFRSKHALACAIVERHAEHARTTTEDVAARNLSGLETLIDISYQLAVDDISDPMTRAGLNLVESIGRTEDLGARVLADWVARFTAIGRRAVAEGDLTAESDPEVLARLLVSMYLGIRQTSELEDAQRFLQDLERSWQFVLPGVANPDRLGYLRQFIRRRTTLTARKAVPLHPEPPAHTRAGSA